MKYLLLLLFPCAVLSQTVSPENVTIVRDSFGVPHIFAKTDAEVGYGLAWANAEDEAIANQVIHKDAYGVVLVAGDTVLLTENLNVKGTNFIAPKGTKVPKIRLVPDNAELLGCIANVYKVSGHLNEAVQLYGKVLALNVPSF